MPRLPNISKYCVYRLLLAVAFALSKVYARLTPSIGRWGTPSTLDGSAMPTTSRMVGTTSIAWWNWDRNPPLSVILFGQETIIGLRVPPRWLATCLVHWNG